MAKYEILFKQLRLAILRGEYAPNDRLPSENAIAIKHGVSRITSKRALNELAAADLVYRVRGGEPLLSLTRVLLNGKSYWYCHSQKQRPLGTIQVAFKGR
ncbi:hypothetical protein TUA1478L_11970 [Lactiplantibacillus plantarum]|uniref:winged helix-turn-helix domain-containing protein n=1 Tax=Lactiplantibacillus plantarum TaxID=1590 RepID=UPI0021CB006B|nr:GntR family transcriptional regulator [Lactiplantibacillus plantarum]MDV2575547.1 GntR family transcriptional regulator [Lactiplantibacillus plantarum]